MKVFSVDKTNNIIIDAQGMKWTYYPDMQKVVVEGDDSEDGGYECTSLLDAFMVLLLGDYL